MKIENHRLLDDDGEPIPFVESPNVSAGDLRPKYLVIHYTAGRSAKESVDWLTDERAGASAHVVVGRDGSVTQLVPFDRVAWHAGRSKWEGIVGLNRYSIGIELDNAGRLTRQGGKWRAWFGASYPEDEVMEAVHKHEDRPAGWHVYTEKQLDALLEVALPIVKTYELADVVGHEDISPGRKTDPGPAFPLSSFRARLFGRTEDEPVLYENTVALNIREGAGTSNPKLAVAPLPPGTRMEVIQKSGSWRLVDVEGEVAGVHDVQGWVHGGFIRRVE